MEAPESSSVGLLFWCVAFDVEDIQMLLFWDALCRRKKGFFGLGFQGDNVVVVVEVVVYKAVLCEKSP